MLLSGESSKRGGSWFFNIGERDEEDFLRPCGTDGVEPYRSGWELFRL